MKAGPVLTYVNAIQNNLLELIIKTADKNKIPFQRRADQERQVQIQMQYNTGGEPQVQIQR